ncbi:MAG: hypothetical protein GY805_39760 [Chloroflexi bacterium]|nr:hypothetical protein [Chloroflexota bacterium]
MIILNFAHPITANQKGQIEAAAGKSVTAVHHIPCQFDNQQPFPLQVREILDSVPLNAKQWQIEPLLINPPAYAPVAVTLIAQLHGRTGHFPTIIRIRPIPDSDPTQYEVAELINLQTVREDARKNR